MLEGDTLDLNNAIGDPNIVKKLREKAPSNHGAAEDFWQSAMDAPLLSHRLKELVLLGVHASASSVNETAIKRHIRRACSAGAVRHHINWNKRGANLREDLAHLVSSIMRRNCGIASAGFPLFSV